MVGGRPRRVIAVAVLALVAAGACTTDDAAAPPDEADTTTSTQRPDDGVLVIGAVLPSVGPGSEIGASMETALTLGAAQAAGLADVGISEVQVVVREEGDNTSTAAGAVQSLIELGADAIIGPTSSLAVLATLSTAVEAGVLTCAPTASAIALDGFPDDGLLFRTVPSDSLQADALARVVESSGGSRAIVVFLDDAYGRPFGEAARSAVARQGTAIVGAVGYVPSETSIADTADEVAATDADVVVVIGDSTSGPAIVQAIDEASTRRLTYVVNDAVRRPDPATQPFDASLAARVFGASPMARPTSAFLAELRSVDPDATGLFAQNAYDCLTIVLLAALTTASTDPATMAAAIPEVTNSGTTCADFSSCRTALAEGRNIDYEGPAGALSIDAGGEMVSAVFERFGFDETGRDIALGLLRIGD